MLLMGLRLTAMTQKETAMFRLISISVVFSLAGTFACAAPQSSDKTGATPYTGDEEVIVSSQALREVHSSTRITNTEETFFCDGHKLSLVMSLKVDYTKTEDFTVFNVAAVYDGQDVDMDDVNAKLNNLGDRRNIGFDFYCLNSQIILSTYAYPGAGTIRESKIDTIFIDLETGNILKTARRSPPNP